MKQHVALIHGALCLVAGFANGFLSPPVESLYYWWFAPLDAAALLLTPLLALAVTARGAFVAVTAVAALEAIALAYMAVLSTEPHIFTFGIGILVLARIPAAWSAAARYGTPLELQRGCVS